MIFYSKYIKIISKEKSKIKQREKKIIQNCQGVPKIDFIYRDADNFE